MGNRAVITTSRALDPKNSEELGVYLHWNGGINSVAAFLKYCKLKGYRPPEQDNYGWARLCQVIGNFFGGGLSIGIDKCCNLDCNNYDNGTYIIKDWEIVDRKYAPIYNTDDYDLEDMLLAIDECQPVKEQLGKFLIAKEIPITDVELNDEVFIFDDAYNKYEKYKVVGFGKDEKVNGIKYEGIPYVNKYGDEEKGYAWNCNNYIKGNTVRVCKKRTIVKVSKQHKMNGE